MTECPKCQGPVWDNREKKRSGQMKPTAPDFSCRDREGCGWKQWPPRDKKPAFRGGNGSPPTAKVGSWNELAATYKKSRDVAVFAWGEKSPPDVLVAATATVFIQAMRDGLHAKVAKPAPPPDEPPPEDEGDDLPF